MTKKQILERLNNQFKENNLIFEITDSEKEIVGFINDGTFKNIISVIEPTESEMEKLIAHLDKHLKK